MNRVLRFVLAAVLACPALMLTACQGSPSGSNDKKTYKIGVLRIDDSLPLYTAETEKLFAKHGVDVQVIEFSSAADQQKAMEAGELDGMMTDMIVTALLKKAGTDVRVVAMALGAVPQEGRFLVVSSPNSSITTPQQLTGAYRDMAMKKANISAAVAGSYRTPSYTAHALPTEEEVSRIMNWMVEKGLLPKAYSYDEMVAHVQ